MKSVKVLRPSGWFLNFFLILFTALVMNPAPVVGKPPGTLNTVAPADIGDGGRVEEAWLGALKDLVIDAQGNLYFPDLTFSVVRQVTPSGEVNRIAGTGVQGNGGHGRKADKTQLSWPFSLAMDPEGNLFISDFGNNEVVFLNRTKHKMTIFGGIEAKPDEIVTVAGDGTVGDAGDGGPATAAQLAFPRGLALHADHPGEPLSLYISDIDNNRVRRVDGKTGIITTFAGTGCFAGEIDGPGGDPCDDVGDGAPPTQAAVGFPTGIAFDSFGDLFILEFNGRVRKVKDGLISTIAGAGGTGYGGDNGPASAAIFAENPHAPVFDAAGNFFFADSNNHRVRRFEAIEGEVTADSTVTTVVGSGFKVFGFEFGYYSLGDNGVLPTMASVDEPTGLAFDENGLLFLVQESGVIRVVDPGGNRLVDGGADETIFEIGARGGIKFIFGIAADGMGNVAATEVTAARIRMTDKLGRLTTVAGNGIQAFTLDGPGGDLRDDPLSGVPAVDTALGHPLRLGFDPAGNLYFTEWYPTNPENIFAASLRRIRAVGGAIGPSSPIETVASLNGDPAFLAFGIAVESEQRQYVASALVTVIWAVETVNGTTTLRPIAGTGNFGHSGDGGPALDADIGLVFGMALDEKKENLYFAENSFLGLIGTVRRINLATGVITTVFVPESPAAECCSFFANPVDIAVIGDTLYVVDEAYERVLRVDLSATPPVGILAAGIGPAPLFPPFPAAFDGDGVATEIKLHDPSSLARDPQGNLYTGEQRGQRIRRLE